MPRPELRGPKQGKGAGSHARFLPGVGVLKTLVRSTRDEQLRQISSTPTQSPFSSGGGNDDAIGQALGLSGFSSKPAAQMPVMGFVQGTDKAAGFRSVSSRYFKPVDPSQPDLEIDAVRNDTLTVPNAAALEELAAKQNEFGSTYDQLFVLDGMFASTDTNQLSFRHRILLLSEIFERAIDPDLSRENIIERINALFVQLEEAFLSVETYDGFREAAYHELGDVITRVFDQQQELFLMDGAEFFGELGDALNDLDTRIAELSTGPS